MNEEAVKKHEEEKLQYLLNRLQDNEKFSNKETEEYKIEWDKIKTQ